MPPAGWEPSVCGISAAGSQPLLAGPAWALLSPRPPPQLPLRVSALGSGTGRLSLGRAVTSPGHRPRRRLPEVSLRTAGRARRARAHTHALRARCLRAHSPRPAPRAHPLTRTPPSSALDRAWRPPATRMATETLLSHTHSLESFPRPSRPHTSAAPAAHRLQPLWAHLDTHQPRLSCTPRSPTGTPLRSGLRRRLASPVLFPRNAHPGSARTPSFLRGPLQPPGKGLAEEAQRAGAGAGLAARSL